MTEELAIILCVAGIVCVSLEVYLPGGIIGTIGAVAILAAIYFGYQSSGTFGTMLLVCGLAGSAGASYLSFKYLTKSPAGRRALLMDTNTEVPEEKYKDLVGMSGVALCDLRPTGRIEINDSPFDAQTRGEYVEGGSAIEVVSVEADHIFVKQVKKQMENTNS